jgi:putative transcriptional regulator
MRNHLRRIRRDRDLTQHELAERIGVSRQTIVSIERERFKPSVELALKLARELDATVEELFQLEDKA